MGKIIIIGASGTIGRAVCDLLEEEHDVIRVGNHQGDHTIDLGSRTDIETLFERLGTVDAVISTAGQSRFAHLLEANDEDFGLGIDNKLMGQVNLTRTALRYLAETGVITLTSGLLAREPWPGTVPTAMVNAALEGFVRAAALDLPRGMRINVVSPIFVTETAVKLGMDTVGSMPASETAKAYRASLLGEMTGHVLDVRKYGKMKGDDQ